jgi:hypothetical protein
LLLRRGKIESVERVTARGREMPLLRSRDSVVSAG